MTSILVTGSLAYDRIAVFPDKFSKHILKGHVHNLNVSFTVSDMAVNYGGTGGNIAYNLALMGEKPSLLASIGYDADEYVDYLKKLKIELELKKVAKLLTASATIMTDMDDNQITSFYMGAMGHAHEAKMSKLGKVPEIAVIAPNGLRAMQEYADYCFKNEIPFIADPGQAIPAFGKKELQDFITGAHMLVLNDYEWEMLKKQTGWDTKKVLERVNYLIVTYAGEGSKIWGEGATVTHVPAYKAKAVDPTGCGDAYRAGLLYGYKNGHDIEASATIGAWVAAKAVEKKGTQNHRFSKTDFKKFLKSL